MVLVVWDDASSLEDGWVDPDEVVPKNHLAYTVGYVIADTEDFVVLAMTTDGVWVNGRFQIPKRMVKEMKPLKEFKQRRYGNRKAKGLSDCGSHHPTSLDE